MKARMMIECVVKWLEFYFVDRSWKAGEGHLHIIFCKKMSGLWIFTTCYSFNIEKPLGNSS